MSSVLLTLELPAVVFCAHIILGEQISFLQIIGIAIMIGAIIWLNLAKNNKVKKNKPAEVRSIPEQTYYETEKQWHTGKRKREAPVC